MDYIHFNPVWHHLKPEVADWPYSLFHHAVRMAYPMDWAGGEVGLNEAGEA